MDKKKLEVFTFVTDKSKFYADFCGKLIKRFASNKNIDYKCILSGKVDDIPDEWEVAGSSSDVGFNSSNHALALNLAHTISTAENVILMDCDIAILYPGWDDVIIENLKKYDLFGFNSNNARYKNFPNVFFFCYNNRIKEKKIMLDFLPQTINVNNEPKAERIIVENKETSMITGIETGKQIKCDTGWKLPFIAKEYNLSHEIIQHVSARSKNAKLPKIENSDIICQQFPGHQDEWHYEEKLFGTHKQASRSHDKDSCCGKTWIERINNYVRKM